MMTQANLPWLLNYTLAYRIISMLFGVLFLSDSRITVLEQKDLFLSHKLRLKGLNKKLGYTPFVINQANLHL